MKDSGSTQKGFRVWLMLLTAFAAVPMIVFSVVSTIIVIENQRKVEKEHIVRKTIAIASAIDRHLSAMVAVLNVLANGDAVRNGDMYALYNHAVRLTMLNKKQQHFALVDYDGTILFNTLRPFGQALPDTRELESARRVIDTGRPAVTMAFEGTVSHQRVTALGVPILMGGERRLCLRVILPIMELETILAQQHLPDAWYTEITDAGQLVASYGEAQTGEASLGEGVETSRNRPSSQEVIETALAEVADWGWTVAVSVPERTFVAPLRRLLVKFGIGGAISLLAALVASWWLSRRLDYEVRNLARASVDLARGESSLYQNSIIREMGEVRACLLEARDRQVQAMTDALTGIAGRARFWEQARELERKSQVDAAVGLAVLFIDLDGFKHVNDRYGHERGDWVLKRAAAIVRESIRAEDVAGRLGGDEFAVCLVAAAGQLRAAAKAIAARIVDRVGKLGYGIGCSIGVSLCENGSPQLERALNLADRAMYEAKRLGKNRYILHEDTTSGPDAT